MSVGSEDLKKAIAIIEKNKEFFAEYLKRGRDQEHLEREGDLRTGDLVSNAPRMMPYIFQWEERMQSVRPVHSILYQSLRRVVLDILKRNSTPIPMEEALTEGLSKEEDERRKKGEEPRLEDRGINRIVEHNNALSETIKGALYDLAHPDTRVPGFIRPHDYLWRYRENNRLDAFLQAMPEYVKFLIEYEEIIDELGSSFKEWWKQNKRGRLKITKYQNPKEKALKKANILTLNRLWYNGEDVPPLIDNHGNIIPVSFFKRAETEIFIMRVAAIHTGRIKFADFQITRTPEGYYSIDNRTIYNIDELIEFGKNRLEDVISQQLANKRPKI